MTTTDSNGIVFVETTDSVSPLQTLLNALQQGTSDAFTALPGAQIYYAADVAARNLYATTHNPALVHLAGAGYQVSTDAGVSWKNVGGFGEPNTAVAVTTGAFSASALVGDHAVIAAADYDRVVEFDGIVNSSGVSAAASWAVVATSSGGTVATNVLQTMRFPFSTPTALGGAASAHGSFDLPAGSTAQPRLWVLEISGTGTLTVADGTWRVRVRAAG